jgi:opacity protein-like surface antigen
MRFTRSRFPALLVSAIILAMALSTATPLVAREGFRFNKPKLFVGGHIGLNAPRAGSDLFDLVTRELTLEKSDFRSPAFGVDLGIPIGSHFATVISLGYSRATPHSESRDFVDASGDPISQTTRFSQVPVTATLRYYPWKTGETIGSYAWVPARLLPYIGGGIGFIRYGFSQAGSFVDRDTLTIFRTELSSDGYSSTYHVVTGMDVSISPLVFVNGEVRYSRAKANLTGQFSGFQPIDLNGLRVIGGVYFRF